MRSALALGAAALAACSFAQLAAAAPGRVSIGIDPGASPSTVGAEAQAATGGKVSTGLAPIGALVLAVPDVKAAVPQLARVPGVSFVEPVTESRSLSFAPTDPLAGEQWYLQAIHGFDFWTELEVPPVLPPVRVAVIDSGLDGDHPEFVDKVVASVSFVDESQGLTDTLGHGTIVAGEIAATLDNDTGIAGLGFPVQLLVAKVVDDEGSISVENESKAIRWAVDNGAQVINLSLGGHRDPANPALDTYSELERSAVDYATSKGVLVVAAAGNCTFAPCPEQYADWPAALPHVVGVAATGYADDTAAFSNRDSVHDDLAAPGVGILSTFPVGLTDPSCTDPGYTRCASAIDDWAKSASGTSFSAPLVTAAASLVIAQSGSLGLHVSQLTNLVERSARDIGVAGHDSETGWGLLDVPAALQAAGNALPARDDLEPNDDPGEWAATVAGKSATVDATVTRYEDPRDVYRYKLQRGQRITLRLSGPTVSGRGLTLWRPGTLTVGAGPKWRAAGSKRVGSTRVVTYKAPKTGWYYAAVTLQQFNGGAYRLTFARR
ncbi:MAG TPA: S8 family serine peptidase [Gaiellaceae bacterium]|jgi:subtilisin family serine protease